MRVAVIGTGIVGASAAYQLAKKNIEVIMIDRKENGKATSAGAGIVCPWISRVDNEDWYNVAKRGARFYERLIHDLEKQGEYNTGYKKVGALSVSDDASELDEIEKRVKRKKKDAPEVGDISRLSSKETNELFPVLDEGLQGVFVSGAARIDGALLRAALKRAAVKLGARLIEGEANLIKSKGKISGVKVNNDEMKVDKILITTGAWAPELLKPLGMTLNIEPQKGQIAHIILPNTDTSNWPVVLPQSSHYMLAFEDSRVVAGATREDDSGFDYRLTAGGVNEVLSEALKVAPGLETGSLEEVRIGFRPMGPDILPIIGSLDEHEEVVLATGLGASGLTMGPYVGSLAASIINKDSVELNLEPYNPARAIKKEELI
ncbi:MAG TPA: FAD-binding oxidoreductase [Virgibacillus sp.]|nr:FAD-binding oxidoreductase [Virgibacillus sp.]HLR65712.1 FAD-binding oxidoreductase [Virgibacillus sp.]